jgi:hypothetical protein
MTDTSTEGDLAGATLADDGTITLTCECGFSEVTELTGEYRFIPTGLYRWHVDAEHSVITQVLQHRYICPSCFAKLPEE